MRREVCLNNFCQSYYTDCSPEFYIKTESQNLKARKINQVSGKEHVCD